MQPLALWSDRRGLDGGIPFDFVCIGHRGWAQAADIRILEWLDEQSVLDEADKGTVFLARDVMDRLRRLTDRRWSAGSAQRPRSTYARGGRRMS